MTLEGRLAYGIILLIILAIVMIVSSIGIIQGKNKHIRRMYGCLSILSVLLFIFIINSLGGL